jgi:hypothetical protein
MAEDRSKIATQLTIKALATEVFGDLTDAESEFLDRLEEPPFPPVIPRPVASKASGDGPPSSDSDTALSDNSTTKRFRVGLARAGQSTRTQRTLPVGAGESTKIQRTETVGGRVQKLDANRIVRVALVRWLCRGKDIRPRLTGQSLEIYNARFDSRLALSHLELPAPLVCLNCWLPGGIELENTKASDITIDESWIGPLEIPTKPKPNPVETAVFMAEGLRATGTVSLRNTHVIGAVDLIVADIAGDLTCSESKFYNPGGRALTLDRATIRSNAHLRRGFSAAGQVRLVLAKISGDLDCTTGTFTNGDGNALALDGAKIDGTVRLRSGFIEQADGKVDPVPFTAEGTVRLYGASIGGSLECIGAKLHADADFALQAEKAKIGGDVFLGVTYKSISKGWNVSQSGPGMYARGEVRFFGAHIGGDVIAHAAHLVSIGGIALNLERASISGSVLLRFQFEAEGEVRLFGATIGGELSCAEVKFTNQDKAIDASKARIGGSVEFSDRRNPTEDRPTYAVVKGKIVFFGAVIGRDLQFCGTDLSGDLGGSLEIEGTEIKGTFVLRRLRLHDNSKINLTDTSCGLFTDDVDSWPQPGKLTLDGFVYRRLTRPKDAKRRHEWLLRQLPADKSRRVGSFRPQPYQTAAQVFRAQGLPEQARKLMIYLAVDRRRWTNQTRRSRVWQFILWLLMKNGYCPLCALGWLVLWWSVGFLAFGLGYQAHVLMPLDKGALDYFTANGDVPASYEPFCAFSYAVDSALPIVSLGQRDKWHVAFPETAIPEQRPIRLMPRNSLYTFLCQANFFQGWVKAAPSPSAEILATYLTVFRWFFVPIGWFLTTMMVAGVAGLVARE